MSDNNNRPVYRLRYGNVVAAVWANNSQSGYFYSTTVVKIYVDEGGKWGESTSFDDRDLPSLAKAAADVHTWIHQQKANAVTVNGTDAA